MPKRLWCWTRVNLALLLASVAVIAAVITGGLLTVSVANSEESLRDAELALAELANLGEGLAVQPGTAVHHGDASSNDLVLNRGIRHSALRASARVVAYWPTAEAREIRAQTVRTSARSAETLAAAYAGDIRAARRGWVDGLRPAAANLAARIEAARATLGREIGTRQSETTATVLAISGGLGLALVVVIFGVTRSRRERTREEAEQAALLRSQQRMEALVRHGSDTVAVLAPDTTVHYIAGAVRRMLGRDAAELEGRKFSDLVKEEEVPTLLALCAGANGHSPARELCLRHGDGSLRTCEARATSLLGDDLWNGVVLNIWDISERKELEERLRHQAFHDGLTGLANRVLFAERLEHALSRALRSRGSVTVFLIDLDDFKSINDSLGHPVGDRLLQAVARRLDESMRAADTVARLGGDEFGVIFDQSASTAEDEAAAWRMIEAFSRPFEVSERHLPVTASIGIARGRAGEVTVEQLVRDADLAMYSAKARQKGSFATYEAGMHIATEERLRLKADLLRAVAEGGQLELFYQPVVSLADERIVGLEALLRWNHPERGLIAPADFVPLAEETGAIVEIGRWVLREATRQGSVWIRQLDPELVISLNVSARQLQGSELADDVRAALADSGLSPRKLVLEVTETELMSNIERATEVLREIKRLGVRIAIDDFGTGYSSLSQLERLPVDILKVDREFARSSEDRADHTKLLRAVMEIGDSLHLRTVAEGIETPDQLEELRALECPLGQGYLFSRPIRVEGVEELLRTGLPRRFSAAPLEPEARQGEGSMARPKP